MKKIGIFGGRFDPVHMGHLILAQDVQEALKLDKVIFLVSYHPPHRNTVAPFEARYKMVKLAVQGNPYFEASDFEKKLNLPKAYTVEVLKKLKELEKAEFYFIMGADQFNSLESWYHPEELVQMANLVVLKRPAISLKTSRFSREVIFLDERLIEISSTEIRERIQKGLPLRYLLPETVERYIKENSLYI